MVWNPSMAPYYLHLSLCCMLAPVIDSCSFRSLCMREIVYYSVGKSEAASSAFEWILSNFWRRAGLVLHLWIERSCLSCHWLTNEFVDHVCCIFALFTSRGNRRRVVKCRFLFWGNASISARQPSFTKLWPFFVSELLWEGCRHLPSHRIARVVA